MNALRPLSAPHGSLVPSKAQGARLEEWTMPDHSLPTEQACCYKVGIILAGSKCGHQYPVIFSKGGTGRSNPAKTNSSALHFLSSLVFNGTKWRFAFTVRMNCILTPPKFCCLGALNAQDCAGTVVALNVPCKHATNVSSSHFMQIAGSHATPEKGRHEQKNIRILFQRLLPVNATRGSRKIALIFCTKNSNSHKHANFVPCLGTTRYSYKLTAHLP